MSSRTVASVLASLGVAVAAGACGVEVPTGPPRAGDPLPELSFTTLDGDSVSTADFRGDAVLLNLWATWCPPCRAEMPYLQEIQEEFAAGGLRVVGVSVDDMGARESLVAFLGESGVEYEILLDPTMASMDRLGVLGLPATFMVDPEGIVTWVRTGPVQEGDEAFLAAIRGALPGDAGAGASSAGSASPPAGGEAR